MSEIKNRPRLWSDFDGTAVELVSRLSPRHYTTYPLAAVEGYHDFLSGVQEGGVEIAGVVSARANRLYRRWATVRSVGELGLREFFADPGQLTLAGNEKSKASFVVSEAGKGTVGLIDDRPHRIGTSLFSALAVANGLGLTQEKRILLGMTSHSRSQEYMERFAEGCAELSDHSASIEATDTYLEVVGASFTLKAVALPPYSADAGKAFAATLTEFAEN